ncbi:cysteine-rich receptor-like protein kinase, partial [Trifolium medium]|nr:cysteine-rich receptor-like protein kinase [Trifolium medium]
SSFLFLLAADGLNVMMSALVSNRIFTPYGIRPQNSVSVSHLQFADDTLLVGVKNWANVRALKAVLILFESFSGLKVNFHKSMLFGVNVNDSWLHEAASVMNCKHGRLPFLYLGLPIGGDPQKLQFWYSLVDRIHNRLSGWKCKNLSMGGRLVLLKSVMASIPIYFLSFFKAPSGKWVWRLLEERESLWNVVLRAKYGQEVGGCGLKGVLDRFGGVL